MVNRSAYLTVFVVLMGFFPLSAISDCSSSSAAALASAKQALQGATSYGVDCWYWYNAYHTSGWVWGAPCKQLMINYDNYLSDAASASASAAIASAKQALETTISEWYGYTCMQWYNLYGKSAGWISAGFGGRCQSLMVAYDQALSTSGFTGHTTSYATSGSRQFKLKIRSGAKFNPSNACQH